MCESHLVEIEKLKKENEALQAKLDSLEENEDKLFEKKLHERSFHIKISNVEYWLSYDKQSKDDHYIFLVDDKEIVNDITCDLQKTIDELEREKRNLAEETAELKDRCDQYQADIQVLERRNEALEETFEMIQATSPTPVEVSDGRN